MNPTPTMGSIRVVSKRKGGVMPIAGETIVDVDRAHPVLGNRHILVDHRDDAERTRVIAANAEDFRQDAARQGPMFQALTALATRVAAGERIALRCWCAPDCCHADGYAATIAEIAGIDWEPPSAHRRSAPRPGQSSLF